MQIMAWMKRQWAGKCRHLYTDKVEQVMKLTEIYQNKKTVLSIEIFPPKKEEELKNIDVNIYNVKRYGRVKLIFLRRKE